MPLGGGPDMQAHGRVSIGDHAAERADPPPGPTAQSARAGRLLHDRASPNGVSFGGERWPEWKNFVVRQFARNGEPLTVTS